MNRIAKAATLALIALVATALPSVAQANVAGTWTISVMSPEGSMDLTAEFAQDGSTVTGTVSSPMTGSTDISEGSIEANKFSFVLYVDVEGTPITVEGSAEIEGDEMSGEFYVAEFGSMPFSAKKGG